MIAAALLAAAACPAAAQQPAPAVSKIAFVDTERVLRDSRASQRVQKSLEAEIQKREREIAGGPKGDIDRRMNGLAEDMRMRREIELKQFIEKTDRIIRRIAEAEKIDAVFSSASYSSARIDITDRVIKALDAAR